MNEYTFKTFEPATEVLVQSWQPDWDESHNWISEYKIIDTTKMIKSIIRW